MLLHIPCSNYLVKKIRTVFSQKRHATCQKLAVSEHIIYFGRGSVPDAARGAHSAPSHSLDARRKSERTKIEAGVKR